MARAPEPFSALSRTPSAVAGAGLAAATRSCRPGGAAAVNSEEPTEQYGRDAGHYMSRSVLYDSFMKVESTVIAQNALPAIMMEPNGCSRKLLAFQ